MKRSDGEQDVKSYAEAYIAKNHEAIRLLSIGYRVGIRAAAEFANQFTANTPGDKCLEDVILCKFNLISKREMRKKKTGK